MGIFHNIIYLRKSEEKKPASQHIPTHWDDKDLGDWQHHKHMPIKKDMDLITKLFLISVMIFLLAVSYLIYNFSNPDNNFSQANIDFILTTPDTVGGGENNSLPITVTNRNSISLLSAYIIFSYDSGQNISGAANLISKRIDLGEIAVNSSMNNSVDTILYGEVGEIRKLNAILYYSIPNQKAVFNKKLNPILITIKSSPVTLVVNNFKEMFLNTNYTFEIFVKNNTENNIQNLMVSVKAPSDFVYTSSSLNLYNRNPSWLIQNLAKGMSTKISFIGKLVGAVGNNEDFIFYAGTRDNNSGLNNIYAQVNKSIVLASSYLDIQLVNSDLLEGKSLTLDRNYVLEFSYKNNLNFPIENVSLLAKLTGDFFDKQSIHAVSGNYEANTNMATWDKNTLAALAQIPANGFGKFILNLKLSKNNMPTNDNPDFNKIKLQIFSKGERNSEDSVPTEQNISWERSWNVKIQ